MTVYPECNIASSQAYDFAIDLDESQSTLKAEISMAQQHYQKSTDVQCSSAFDFKVDDKVFIKAQFFQTTQPTKKLSEKYLRLYEIISQPDILLFILCLLKSMHSVYLVFHMSMLKPATSNTFPKRIQLVPILVIINSVVATTYSMINDSTRQQISS